MRYLKFPLILLAGIIVILLAIWFLKPHWLDRRQRNTSDSASSSEVIHFAGDGYLGYWFINSPDMKKQAKEGVEIDFTDDGGNYADRLLKFNEGKYDAIVLPINSYLQHGAKYDYPGVIVAGISESKGADAILGFSNIMPNGKVNELDDAKLKIVYTGQSPSSFLLDLTISDFDLNSLANTKAWQVEKGSSEEVYEVAAQAVKNRQYGDVFVMWEPEVSKAIDKLGLKYLWGSDKFAGYILDVFVFRRDFISKKPETVQRFLSTYFSVLQGYHNSANRERMIKEMAKSTRLKEDVVSKMVDKIDWYNLPRNATELFGLQMNPSIPARDGLVNSIIACSEVLIKNGDVDQGSVRDPYRIINSNVLRAMLPTQPEDQGALAVQAQAIDFSKVKWGNLSEAGTMRVEPINFQRGREDLDDYGKEAVDRVATVLVNNYPNFWIMIKGHTGPGDEKANKKLSEARAKTVMQRLIAVHNVQPERLKAEGKGNSEIPVRRAGEDNISLELR
ncbi:MAG: hypothetical protein E4H16_04755, partial [Candidatus Atribacteria bacterium]